MNLRRIVLFAAAAAACASTRVLPDSELGAQEASLRSLRFNPGAYQERTAEYGGRTIRYRAYEGIIYVEKPADDKYQRLNFYAPAEYYEGGSVDGFTAADAPIFFPNAVGGYMPAEPLSPGMGRDGAPNALVAALAKGCAVAAPGARGRTLQDASGRYTGKAPAAIVDLKAAVRYLRYNDAAMPGSAERIVPNGTSAGGALSALLGASGNSADYGSYLRELGAAEARDDVFAVSAYCPITNLENADGAYEWLFQGVYDYKKIVMKEMTDWRLQREEVQGTLTAEERVLSAKLASLFPAYLNSLRLRAKNGALLSLDQNGNGSFKDYAKSFVLASARRAAEEGTDLSSLPWVRMSSGAAADIDFDAYVRHIGRMKLPPAFDGLDLSNGENSLFGTADRAAAHFTPFGRDNGSPGAPQADGTIVGMMNPMNYLGAPGSTAAAHWRIRHGSADRDTSLAVPLILATKLENLGCSVDFALPWNRGHGGDYDLEELFRWIAAAARTAR